MLRMNLSIHNCRAQCYDGAAVAQICAEESRAIFIHCYDHALNCDTVKHTNIALGGLKAVKVLS